MTLQLDTSGEVVLPYPHLHPWRRGYRWSDLTPFQQGYIEALFSERAEDEKTGGWFAPLGGFRGFSDLAPETVQRIVEDCARMQTVLPKMDGATFWTRRNGPFGFAGFPPLAPSLSDDGLVYLTEGVG